MLLLPLSVLGRKRGRDGCWCTGVSYGTSCGISAGDCVAPGGMLAAISAARLGSAGRRGSPLAEAGGAGRAPPL